MNKIPTFTPPTPTFTPPAPSQRSGATCHFHRNENAVDRCASCGKFLCQDCAETYGVNDEQYAGKSLCYDCCTALVRQNVKELKKQRAKIIAMYIFTALGMIFGAILGATAIAGDSSAPGWIPVLTAFIGGCLWTFIVNLGKIFVNTIKNFARGAWLGGIFWLIIDLIKAIFIAVWGTIKKLFTYTKHLIQTSGFIKSDTQALQNLADYMEYTMVMSQNVGVDLASLMTENSELYDNSFAQNVMANGAASAEASLQGSVATCNEHGEIIRGFEA